MADVYVDSNLVDSKLGNHANMKGAETITLAATFELAASDAAGDIKRIASGLSPNLIPTKIDILCVLLLQILPYSLHARQSTYNTIQCYYDSVHL